MKSPTVLCVDDDAGIRKLYGTLLGQNGYEVIAANNGRHALHVFQDQEDEIDAVILDYEMPGMNGLELAAWLKHLHPTLPIINDLGFASGTGSNGPVCRCRDGERRPVTEHLGPSRTAARLADKPPQSVGAITRV